MEGEDWLCSHKLNVFLNLREVTEIWLYNKISVITVINFYSAFLTMENQARFVKIGYFDVIDSNLWKKLGSREIISISERWLF